MGQIFSKIDRLKSPKRSKGPPRRPPSAVSRTRRSATEKKATVDLSKADLDSVTAEVGTVLENPNKNRAQRPQNRRPPARARQTRAETFLNGDGDTPSKAQKEANDKDKTEPPAKTKKPQELSIEKSQDVSEVDAVHHRLSEKKFLIPPSSNNSVQRGQPEEEEKNNKDEDEEDGNESECSNDALSSKKKQRKLSKVLSLR